MAANAHMKRLFILKIGSTYPAIAKRHGDFDVWTMKTLGDVNLETRVLDIEHGAPLPAADGCAGVVIMGSHAYVTDGLPWSIAIEQWIPTLLQARIPLLGICYGHQLLARATGGTVGFHPGGAEFGSVPVRLLPDCADDLLFSSLPGTFPAHVTHSQTVLRLPPDAVLLASGIHEPHQAFRIGECAWGVQFHPEYTADIMRSYIEAHAVEIASAGRKVVELLQAVEETPIAALVLKNFGRFVEDRLESTVVAGHDPVAAPDEIH